MKKIRDINRRDFINGFALSIAAGSSLSPLEILANQKNGLNTSHYPPALMGMRGSNPGSFEVAHALAWGGAKFNNPKHQYTKALIDAVSEPDPENLYKEKKISWQIKE